LLLKGFHIKNITVVHVEWVGRQWKGMPFAIISGERRWWFQPSGSSGAGET
jgi:hypothetical protein